MGTAQPSSGGGGGGPGSSSRLSRLQGLQGLFAHRPWALRGASRVCLACAAPRSFPSLPLPSHTHLLATTNPATQSLRWKAPTSRRPLASAVLTALLSARLAFMARAASRLASPRAWNWSPASPICPSPPDPYCGAPVSPLFLPLLLLLLFPLPTVGVRRPGSTTGPAGCTANGPAAPAGR